MTDAAERDFFISYASPDQPWAEWLGWQLEEAGHSAVIQVWDFTPGSNFVVEMDRAARFARRTILVLSPDLLQRPFPTAEWAAAFATDPTGVTRRLIPVRVRDCEPDGLLAQVVYIDLVGRNEADARRILLGGLRERTKPDQAPTFPGDATDADPPAFPPDEETEPIDVSRAAGTPLGSRFSTDVRQALDDLHSDSPRRQAAAAAYLEVAGREAQPATAEALARVLGANLLLAHASAVNRVLVKAFECALRSATAVSGRLSQPIDLSRRDLRRADLTGLNLEGSDFAFAALRGANLSNASLRRSYGYQVDLEHARLDGADLEEVRFKKAIAPTASFRGARLVSAHLREAVLPEADFAGAQMQGAHLDGADLRGARFSMAILSDAFFRGAEFDESSLRTVLQAVRWETAHWDEETRDVLANLSANRPS